MDTSEVLPLPKWCFFFFGFSSHLVVERDLCFLCVPEEAWLCAAVDTLALPDTPETVVLARPNAL